MGIKQVDALTFSMIGDRPFRLAKGDHTLYLRRNQFSQEVMVLDQLPDTNGRNMVDFQTTKNAVIHGNPEVIAVPLVI